MQALDEGGEIRLTDLHDARVEHIVFRAGPALLRCLLERQAKLAAMRRSGQQSLTRILWDSLLPHIPIFRCSRDSDHKIRPLILIQTRNHEWQTLRYPPSSSVLLRPPIARGVDEPERKSRERRWMAEQPEVRAFSHRCESEGPEWADGGFVEKRGALADDGFVQCHG